MGIVLRGYKEIPSWVKDWMRGESYWVAVAWQHLTKQTYMDMFANGEIWVKNPDVVNLAGFTQEVPPEINLVLDAWIRWIDECWEID